MQSTINQRIKILIDTLEKGKQSAFANNIDVTPSVVNNIIGGRMNEPSFKVLQKITDAYANVNLNWLLTGEGDMLKEKKGGTSYQITGNSNQQGQGIKVTATDEGLRKDLEECRKEVDKWRNKYIELLEKQAGA